MREELSGLTYYERHIACVLISLLIFLGCQSCLSQKGNETTKEMVSISVVGAVKEQTLFRTPGVTVDSILQNIDVQEDADLLEVDGSRRIAENEILVIPYHGKLTVYVTGAVVEAKLVVAEKNATVADILDHVILADDADVKRVMRRRVRNASVLTVPCKIAQKRPKRVLPANPPV
jgi:hypothetical protein